jgi:hypothetical protein
MSTAPGQRNRTIAGKRAILIRVSGTCDFVDQPKDDSAHPRYVDGSDTIPRRGLRHDAVVRGPESEQTTVKGPGFSRTGFQEDGLSHRASFLNMKITPDLFEAA